MFMKIVKLKKIMEIRYVRQQVQNHNHYKVGTWAEPITLELSLYLRTIEYVLASTILPS